MPLIKSFPMQSQLKDELLVGLRQEAQQSKAMWFQRFLLPNHEQLNELVKRACAYPEATRIIYHQIKGNSKFHTDNEDTTAHFLVLNAGHGATVLIQDGDLDETYRMQDGTVYQFNDHIPHALVNFDDNVVECFTVDRVPLET